MADETDFQKTFTYKNWKLYRNGELLFVLIDGVQIPVFDADTAHGYIPKEILQLSGAAFEHYKVAHSELKELKIIFSVLVSCYGWQRQPEKILNVEQQQSLLATDILSDTERDAFLRNLEKIKKRRLLDEKRNEPTFIYLMKDERTELTKIGHSANPSYRERTLQSDNPMILLLVAWLGTPNEEKHLHEKFAHKRFRGEWFDLDKGDIEEIYDIFSDRDIWK